MATCICTADFSVTLLVVLFFVKEGGRLEGRRRLKRRGDKRGGVKRRKLCKIENLLRTTLAKEILEEKGEGRKMGGGGKLVNRKPSMRTLCKRRESIPRITRS